MALNMWLGWKDPAYRGPHNSIYDPQKFWEKNVAPHNSTYDRETSY